MNITETANEFATEALKALFASKVNINPLNLPPAGGQALLQGGTFLEHLVKHRWMMAFEWLI